MSNNAQIKEDIHAWHAIAKAENNTDCVHLSFCPSIYVLKQLEKQGEQKEPAVLLTIDPIAALIKDTKFSCWDASTQRYSSPNDSTETLLKINFDEEFKAPSQYLEQQATPTELEAEPQSDYRNAIILVPDKVPSFLIKDIKLL